LGIEKLGQPVSVSRNREVGALKNVGEAVSIVDLSRIIVGVESQWIDWNWDFRDTVGWAYFTGRTETTNQYAAQQGMHGTSKRGG